MNQSITVEEAQASLPDLADQLGPGDEVVITRDSSPVFKLTRIGNEKPRPILGRGKGKLIIVRDDDSHLEDFKDYM